MRAISSWAKSITPAGCWSGHPRPPSAGAGGTAQAHQRPAGGSAALIEQCDDLDQLRGLEGEAAQRYFDCFDSLILQQHDDFSFAGRSRRPPLDNTNALLSFAYSLLASDCTAALQSVGLDPTSLSPPRRPGRRSLASTSWKSCALFMPTVLCSPASTRRS